MSCLGAEDRKRLTTEAYVSVGLVLAPIIIRFALLKLICSLFAFSSTACSNFLREHSLDEGECASSQWKQNCGSVQGLSQVLCSKEQLEHRFLLLQFVLTWP